MLRETRKNALKNSGFEVRVLVDFVDFSGGFVLGPRNSKLGKDNADKSSTVVLY